MGDKKGTSRPTCTSTSSYHAIHTKKDAPDMELGSPQNDHIMLWAACCLGFFGFLRSGEMTAPENEKFDPGQHLYYADISADNPLNPTMLAVKIKQSKTDQFRHGAKVFLGRTDTPLCPVVAMLAYLAWRGSGDGHLFCFEKGNALTQTLLVMEVRNAVAKAGLKPEDYSGHSFRIGAATTAAACSVPADTIITLGRWSQAYRLYVRIPKEQLAALSQKLATSTL